jgi:hypothetical protein
MLNRESRTSAWAHMVRPIRYATSSEPLGGQGQPGAAIGGSSLIAAQVRGLRRAQHSGKEWQMAMAGRCKSASGRAPRDRRAYSWPHRCGCMLEREGAQGRRPSSRARGMVVCTGRAPRVSWSLPVEQPSHGQAPGHAAQSSSMPAADHCVCATPHLLLEHAAPRGLHGPHNCRRHRVTRMSHPHILRPEGPCAQHCCNIAERLTAVTRT